MAKKTAKRKATKRKNPARSISLRNFTGKVIRNPGGTVTITGIGKRGAAGAKRNPARRGNGYVVYPHGVGIHSLAKAKAYAKKHSRLESEAFRVESVDTQKTVARYRNGKVA